MFERVKAIAIVKHIMEDSKALINAIRECKCGSAIFYPNYAKAETALIALAKFNAIVFLKKERLGNAIAKEYLSGSWRPFLVKNEKIEYGKEIQACCDRYLEIAKTTFNDPSLNPAQKLDITYDGICKHIAYHIAANYTEDCASILMMEFMNLKEYLSRYGK